MNIVPVFVGLDYHQDSVQVCVLDRQGKRLCNRSVKNDAGAIERIATQHGSPRRIAIEACCGAANLAAELATCWCTDGSFYGYVRHRAAAPRPLSAANHRRNPLRSHRQRAATNQWQEAIGQVTRYPGECGEPPCRLGVPADLDSLGDVLREIHRASLPVGPADSGGSGEEYPKVTEDGDPG